MLALAGCSDPSDVEKIGGCGGIQFSDSARVIAHASDLPGLSDEVVEVVAELPLAESSWFKTKSALGQFQAGVPLLRGAEAVDEDGEEAGGSGV